MTYLQTNYSVTVTENCKKIEAAVAKLCSKTKYTTFFLNMVYIHTLCLKNNTLEF